MARIFRLSWLSINRIQICNSSCVVFLLRLLFLFEKFFFDLVLIEFSEVVKLFLFKNDLCFHEIVTIFGDKVNIQNSTIIVDVTKLDNLILVLIVEFVHSFLCLPPFRWKLDAFLFPIDRFKPEVNIHGMSKDNSLLDHGEVFFFRVHSFPHLDVDFLFVAHYFY